MSAEFRKTFTLTHLLVVITLIALVLGVVFPRLQRTREAARRSTCQNNLRQIGIAVHNYESGFMRLPKGVDYPKGFVTSESNREELLFNWSTNICFFMESHSPYEILDPRSLTAAQRWQQVQVNARSRKDFFDVLTKGHDYLNCPSDLHPPTNPYRVSGLPPGNGSPALTSVANSNYVGLNNTGICHGEISNAEKVGLHVNAIPNGIFASHRNLKMTEIEDGTSNTVLFGERVGHSFGGSKNNDPARGALWAVARGIGKQDVIPVTATQIPPTITDALASGQGGINWAVIGEQPSYYRSWMGVSSNHPGIVQFAMADGSAHQISETVDSWYRRPQNLPINSPKKVPTEDVFGVYEKMIAIADSANQNKSNETENKNE